MKQLRNGVFNFLDEPINKSIVWLTEEKDAYK